MAHIQPWQTALLLALWALPLLAYAAPRLADGAAALWRGRDAASALLVLLAIAAAVYAFPSSAEKGGGGPTNEPPPQVSSPAGRINLYHIDAEGRLVPLGAEIRRVGP